MMFIKVDTKRSRAYTCALLEMVDEGIIDPNTLAQDLLAWLSEDEVRRFALRNEYITTEEDEE